MSWNPATPEAVLQRVALARLNAIPGVRVYRTNVVKARTQGGMIESLPVGHPDIAGYAKSPSAKYAFWIGIEFKATDGRVRPAQQVFCDRCARDGALYVFARTLEEAIDPVLEALK